MSTMEEAVRRYAADFPDEQRDEAAQNAGVVLTLLHHPKFALFAEGLSRELTARQIGSSLTLDREQALSLAVTAINVELVNLHDQDLDVRGPSPVACRRMGDDVLTQVTGVYFDRQAAAFAAVRQLGGARAVSIPDWLESAIGDVDFTVCDHLLDRVALAVRHTNPGRAWTHAYGIGALLYQPH